MTEKKENIAKAIVAVIQAVKGIDKSLNVGTGGSSYRGVSDQDVKKEIGREMARNGLCLLPIGVEPNVTIQRWDEVDSFSRETPKAMKSKQQVFTEVKTRYLLLHTSGESIVLEGYGHGVDSQDKSAGKATTYAMKYTMLYSFLVPTGTIDDADKTHSDEIPTPEIIAERQRLQDEAQLRFTKAVELAVVSFSKAQTIDELKELKSIIDSEVIKHPDVVLEARRTFEKLSGVVVVETAIPTDESNPSGLLKKVAEPVPTEKPVDAERELLIQKHFELFGAKPHGKTSNETIMNKIEDHMKSLEVKPEPTPEPIPEVSANIMEEKKDDGFLQEMQEVAPELELPPFELSVEEEIEEAVEELVQNAPLEIPYLDQIIKSGKMFTNRTSMAAWWSGNKATFQERLTPEEWATLNTEFKSHFDSIPV